MNELLKKYREVSISTTQRSAETHDDGVGHDMMKSFKDEQMSEYEFQLYNNKVKLLGRGGFGKVWLVKHENNGQVYAMKEIDIFHVSHKLQMESPMKMKTPKVGHCKHTDADVLHSLLNEVRIMKKMDHLNIVKMHKYYLLDSALMTHNQFETPRKSFLSKKLYLMMEYCPHGSLSKYIKSQSNKKLTELVSGAVTLQILNGLEYLSNQGCIHGDIKAANVLIAENGTIKLCDFGLSFCLNVDDQLYKRNIDVGSEERLKAIATNGSAYWLAPEIILHRMTTPKSDIWSLGATVIEMLTGYPPFFNFGPLPACHAVGKGTKIQYPQNITAQCASFLDACFTFDAVKRPRAKSLKRHSWLENKENVLSFVEFSEDYSDLCFQISKKG